MQEENRIEVSGQTVPPDHSPTGQDPSPESLKGAPDPFDLDRLKLPPSGTNAPGTQKLLVTIPARKPDKAWWIRVHPDEQYRIETLVLELKDARELYLIAADIREHLLGEPTVSRRRIVTAINRQGTLFLWPLRLPDESGKLDPWGETALAGADSATRGWTRISANMALGANDIWQAQAFLSEPEWPAHTFQEMLRVAFRGRMIDSVDHPVLRRLRGEV